MNFRTKRWSKEEEKELIDDCKKSSMTINDIAIKFNRSLNSIKFKLVHFHEKQLIQEEYLNKYINSKEHKEIKKIINARNKNNNSYELEMLNLLRKIDENLNLLLKNNN